MLTFLIEKLLDTRKKATRVILFAITTSSILVWLAMWLAITLIAGSRLNPILGILASALAGIAVWIGLAGAFVVQGLKKIPADPPHKGAETLLGARTGEAIEEGWRFFPFFPYLFGFIPVNVEKKNVNLDGAKAQLVRTPDLALVKIPVHYTYTPVSLVAYLNSGGQEGVENILSDIIAQQLRIWGVKELKSRKTWEDVVKSGNSAVNALIRAIMKAGGFKPTIAQVAGVMNGTEHLVIPNLGIALNRLNVGEIEPVGKLAEAAEQAAKEERERQAEEIERDHVISSIKKIMEALDMSNSEATELFQTERKKVVKEIKEQKLTISPGSAEIIEAALIAVLGRFVSTGGKS